MDADGGVRTAHLNLRDEYLPYRHLIGQVILDVGLFLATSSF